MVERDIFSWAPREESISGIMVFDGPFSGGGEADLGVLARPIELVVKKGRVVEINGEDETKKMSAWLKKLGDPNMYSLEDAVSHADGICLNSTVWVDDELLLKEGEVVHPDLVELAKACGH